MASNYKSQRFWCFHQLLAGLVLIELFTVMESAAMVQVRGEIKGNVTFHCPVSDKKTVKFVYVQRGNEFLNGYHNSKKLDKKWPNTVMDNTTSTMTMTNLNISHTGLYCCHIYYMDNSDEKHEIQLTVTANYSVPSVKIHCLDDNQSCLVTCLSYGGYPKDKMEWDVYPRNTSTDQWKVVNSPEPSPSTIPFNSSSTAAFNCSAGEMWFTCSIGGVTSEMQTVCAQDQPKAPDFPVYIVAICVVLCVVVFMAIVCMKCKTNLRGRVREQNEREDGVPTDDEPLQGLALKDTGHGGMEVP